MHCAVATLSRISDRRAQHGPRRGRETDTQTEPQIGDTGYPSPTPHLHLEPPARLCELGMLLFRLRAPVRPLLSRSARQFPSRPVVLHRALLHRRREDLKTETLNSLQSLV